MFKELLQQASGGSRHLLVLLAQNTPAHTQVLSVCPWPQAAAVHTSHCRDDCGGSAAGRRRLCSVPSSGSSGLVLSLWVCPLSVNPA